MTTTTTKVRTPKTKTTTKGPAGVSETRQTRFHGDPVAWEPGHRDLARIDTDWVIPRVTSRDFEMVAAMLVKVAVEGHDGYDEMWEALEKGGRDKDVVDRLFACVEELMALMVSSVPVDGEGEMKGLLVQEYMSDVMQLCDYHRDTQKQTRKG